MRLSFNLEHFGDCGRALDFYGSAFGNASVKKKTYREMDLAKALGISDLGLDMIWQSELDILCGNSTLCMEMSDSLLTAMQKDTASGHFVYHPVICIQHEDEDYARGLFGKIYGNSAGLESLQGGNVVDSHGIQWRYRKDGNQGIAYCLEFDGFCRDVVSFYERVFGLEAAHVVKYGDSPYGDSVSGPGADMIYNACLQFEHHGHMYVLQLSDSYESARKGVNGYNPDALLFYQGLYNPIFTLRDIEGDSLSGIFERLMSGGKINRPLAAGDQGTRYGSLIDKYGICWNLYSVVGEGNA